MQGKRKKGKRRGTREHGENIEQWNRIEGYRAECSDALECDERIKGARDTVEKVIKST